MEKIQFCLTEAANTHLSEEGFDKVWIGPKWDLGQRGADVMMYRKGNPFFTVQDLDPTCQIIADQEYMT